jgi:ATP synthase protein I
LDSNENQRNAPASPGRKANSVGTQFALAMELPFVFVGAIGVGMLFGYFLDKWLHTKVLFIFIFGTLGFVAGLREILRRLPAGGDGKS